MKEHSRGQKRLASLPAEEDPPEGGYEVDASRWNDPYEVIRAEEIKGDADLSTSFDLPEDHDVGVITNFNSPKSTVPRKFDFNTQEGPFMIR